MAIERLVDELDRSYAEAQERMSDPAVYNDHRQAADGGRRLKELESPKRLADEWREAKEEHRYSLRRPPRSQAPGSDNPGAAQWR